MKIWIYLNGSQQGPFTYDDLRQLPIDASTPVWYDGLPDWTAAGVAPVTAPLFATPFQQPCQQPYQQAQYPQYQQYQQQYQQPYQQPQYQQQAYQQQPVQPQPRPNTYLVWNILLTVLCCSPLAIAGIVTGAMCNSRYNSGDYDGARRMSHVTEWLVILAIVFSVLGLPLTIIMLCL